MMEHISSSSSNDTNAKPNEFKIISNCSLLYYWERCDAYELEVSGMSVFVCLDIE